MTADKAREFLFTTQLDAASVPLLRTALQGAMTVFGFDEETANEAAGIVADHLSGLSLPKKPTKLRFALEHDGSKGSFTIFTEGSLSLSGLCGAIAQSKAWSAHRSSCTDSDKSGGVVVELKRK